MHVDPDLQPECPQCGCEVLFDVQVDGVLVQSEDGLSVRFPVREGRTQVMRAVPLLRRTSTSIAPSAATAASSVMCWRSLGPSTAHNPAPPSVVVRSTLICNPFAHVANARACSRFSCPACSFRPPTGLSFVTPHGPADISNTATPHCSTATMRSIALTATTAPS